jgi:hypothetical protein
MICNGMMNKPSKKQKPSSKSSGTKQSSPNDNLYAVKLIQELVLYEYIVKATDEEKAKDIAYHHINKYDNDLITKSDVQQIDDEDITKGDEVLTQ